MMDQYTEYKENSSFQAKLKEEMKHIDIILSDNQLKQFDQFYQMMIEKNKVMNLTAITQEEEVIRKHFVDSVSCVKVCNLDKVTSIIDIGTGAGFPGIPLKIVYPDIHFLLVDSLRKRIGFLEDVIQALHLKKIKAIHGRAEDLARDKSYRSHFALCLSRAVANLSTLTEYCIPFVKVGGYFISYKSQKGREELEIAANCFKLLGCSLEEAYEFQLEGEDAERLLLKIRKDKKTPKSYPRKSGVPSRDPL